MRNQLRAAIVTGLMVCALLLSIAGAGAASAAPLPGPGTLTPRTWAQTCMRERLGYTGRDLASWHRWCARIQPKRLVAGP